MKKSAKVRYCLYARVEQFDNECNFALIVSDQFLFDKIDSSLKSNCD